MRYEPGEVKAFTKDCQISKNAVWSCLVTAWLTTGHDPTSKTYETLLNHSKQINKRSCVVVSEAIENELIQH